MQRGFLNILLFGLWVPNILILIVHPIVLRKVQRNGQQSESEFLGLVQLVLAGIPSSVYVV